MRVKQLRETLFDYDKKLAVMQTVYDMRTQDCAHLEQRLRSLMSKSDDAIKEVERAENVASMLQYQLQISEERLIETDELIDAYMQMVRRRAPGRARRAHPDPHTDRGHVEPVGSARAALVPASPQAHILVLDICGIVSAAVCMAPARRAVAGQHTAPPHRRGLTTLCFANVAVLLSVRVSLFYGSRPFAIGVFFVVPVFWATWGSQHARHLRPPPSPPPSCGC